MRRESFKTMDPEAKFSSPQPAPVPVGDAAIRRLGSASSLLLNRPSARSLSPAPSWKRFFTRKLASRDCENEPFPEQTATHSMLSVSSPNETRCSSPSEGSRTRDLSPESLRRFLSEDTLARPESNLNHAPTLAIPENIAEEVDDDDNFATSATSENQVYPTCLSPPPYQRCASSDTIPIIAASSSCVTIATPRPSSHQGLETRAAETIQPSAALHVLPKLETNSQPRWSISATPNLLPTPVSPQLVDDESPCSYDSYDEDEILSSNESDNFLYQPLPGPSSTKQSFRGYSLPRQSDEGKGLANGSLGIATLNTPHLLPSSDASIPISGANLLGAPIDTGLDDFVSELGWLVDAIGSGRN